jgi:hypothetical protein
VKRRLTTSIPPPFVIPGSQASGAYPIIQNFPPTVQASYQNVYAESLKPIWISMTVIAGMGFLVSLIIRNSTLDENASDQPHSMNNM